MLVQRVQSISGCDFAIIILHQESATEQAPLLEAELEVVFGARPRRGRPRIASQSPVINLGDVFVLSRFCFYCTVDVQYKSKKAALPETHDSQSKEISLMGCAGGWLVGEGQDGWNGWNGWNGRCALLHAGKQVDEK